jgi:hypothetical protein
VQRKTGRVASHAALAEKKRDTVSQAPISVDPYMNRLVHGPPCEPQPTSWTFSLQLRRLPLSTASSKKVFMDYTYMYDKSGPRDSSESCRAKFTSFMCIAMAT